MAKSENTAINELIARVSGGQTPSPADSSDGLDPGSALDHAITIPVGAALHTTRPASMPVAAPFEAKGPGMPSSYPIVPRAMLPPTDAGYPTAPGGPGAPLSATGTPAPDAVSYAERVAPAPWTPPVAPAWSPPQSGAASTQPVPLNAPRTTPPEHMIGTLRLTRRSDLQIVLGRLVLPMTLLLVSGMLIGGYVAFRGERGVPATPAGASGTEPHAGAQAHLVEPAADPGPPPTGELRPVASAPAAAPSPAASAAPAAASAGASMTAPTAPAASREPPPPAPALAAAAPPAAAERDDKPAAPSEARGGANAPSPASVASAAGPVATPVPAAPSAAAAALVEVRLESTPRGATVTLVDRGKSQYVGTTPVTTSVDPTRTYDLVFSYPNKPTLTEHLDATTTRRVAVTLAGGRSGSESASRRPARSGGDSPAPPRKQPRPPPAVVSNDGILKISTKPPCEIIIDGKPTGLVTPQNEIVLPAGTHRVTLINAEKDISRTFSVELAANTTEKIIEDFLAERPR
ncbi:MAG TPA: hypothetical protein VFT22_40910 [Kofleriaceae bacterium]|nr:hypothetical protein [Kofleriaceae bacterium]